MKFSECLRQAREQAGLTQKELAEKLNVPPQMINRYENSDTEPRIGFVINAANVLGITLDELMKTGKRAPINSFLGIDEFAATTEESWQTTALYCTKLLAPDFKVEYQNGYFVVTACSSININDSLCRPNLIAQPGETLKYKPNTFINWVSQNGIVIDKLLQKEKIKKFKQLFHDTWIFEKLLAPSMKKPTEGQTYFAPFSESIFVVSNKD